MIFFCEDCGAKNDLGKADLKNSKAIFRCRSCQYMNSYTVSNTLDKSEHFFKKIESHPEIIGAFLYDIETHSVKNHIPGVLTEDDLGVLGNYLGESYLVAQSQYPDINEVMIAISDKHITIQNIDTNWFVFVISKTLPLPGTVKELLTQAKEKDKYFDFF